LFKFVSLVGGNLHQLYDHLKGFSDCSKLPDIRRCEIEAELPSKPMMESGLSGRNCT
jgi:hypothetical protein